MIKEFDSVSSDSNKVSRIKETKVDKELEKTDNFSVVMMIVVIATCFVVGIVLGYILYNLALNSSNIQ